MATFSIGEAWTRKYRKQVDGKKWHVHVGLCDGRPTKWITRVRWDGKLTIKMENGELRYRDGGGREMMVFEHDEPGYLRY